jgi:zinc and cadmium transporter
MVEVWTYSIISVIIISLVSLVGIFFLTMNDNTFGKITFCLVGFSIGALFGDTFIHIFPEIAENGGFGVFSALSVLSGIVAFYILEMLINWQHCHIPTSEAHPHPVAYTNLIGDGFHNFIDGMIVAGSFLVDTKLGLATTLAVILHEIPTEMGHFSIFIHAGFGKMKALKYNFLSALTAILGAVVTLVIGREMLALTDFLLPFTAGGFIYIAGSDLIPELHKECDKKRSLIQLMSILAGVGLMMLLLVIG